MSTTPGSPSETALSEHVTVSIQTDEVAAGWRRHPVDLRLTLPGMGGKYYFTLIAGREQRTPERRAQEREKYPVLTLGNVFFAFGLLTIVTFLALASLIAQSAIIEY